MTIINDERLRAGLTLGDTAMNSGVRLLFITLTLVAGTAQQLNIPPNALPVGICRNGLNGGTQGNLRATTAGTTLTVTSDSATEVSDVTVMLLTL